MKSFLGIDVGSVSCNIAIIQGNKVVYTSYARVHGKPIETLQKEFRKIKNKFPKIEISGSCCTGSARFLIGHIVGADIIKNEITSHATGTLHFYPKARTILEIGGQDSKIILLNKGAPVDFAMNTVCFLENTEITTENFLQKPIKDVNKGELVLTHKGRFKKVLNRFKRNYSGQILKIKVGKKVLELTPEHPLLVLKRESIRCYQDREANKNMYICKPKGSLACNKIERCRKKDDFSFVPKFIKAEDIEKGDLILTPLSNFSKNVKINKDFLRVLGYYLSEGSILYNRSRKDKKIKYPCGVTFTFNIKESIYVNRIKDYLIKNYPKINFSIKEIKKRKTLLIEVFSKDFANILIRLAGTGAKQKVISKDLMFLEPELQKEIVKGFFEGDGHLNQRNGEKSSNRYVATTISKNLAYQLYWMILRNKIKCKLFSSDLRCKSGNTAYSVGVYGNDVDKLMDKDLANIKRNSSFKSFIYGDYFYEPIDEINKRNFKGSVYNLEVEEDNSYVASLLAVHNCAAGTGSFLDQQASRLGLEIERFGNEALKSKKPVTIRGRCGIFAESDIINKQIMGHKREDIIKGLCQALVRNYLNNVAKGKEIKEPVILQGGVAANKGIKKAFEEELKVKVIIPEHYGVMGAIGAALIVQKSGLKQTKFRGFNIEKSKFNITSFECDGCSNKCEIVKLSEKSKHVAHLGSKCGKWE